MLNLLAAWGALLFALVVFAIGRPGKGGALTLAYFLGLSLIHVPGVLPFLTSGSGLDDFDETRLGFELTILGMAAFVAGAVLAGADRPAKRCRKGACRRDGGRTCSNAWAGARSRSALSLISCWSRCPPSPVADLCRLGIGDIADRRLMARALWRQRDRRSAPFARDARPVAAAALATLVTGGFLGYGVYWVLSVVAFLFVITRRRTWFYVATPVAVFLGLSLFVTYMGQRSGIREVVWQEQAGLLDRLDRASSMITGVRAARFGFAHTGCRARRPAQPKLPWSARLSSITRMAGRPSPTARRYRHGH